MPVELTRSKDGECCFGAEETKGRKDLSMVKEVVNVLHKIQVEKEKKRKSHSTFLVVLGFFLITEGVGCL